MVISGGIRIPQATPVDTIERSDPKVAYTTGHFIIFQNCKLNNLMKCIGCNVVSDHLYYIEATLLEQHKIRISRFW
jgi:hypothetical protein